MARIFSAALALLVTLNSVFGQPTRGGSQTSTTANQLASANNRFALNLLKQLPRSENLFFSPLSISTALAMVHLGARHSTAQNMEQALGYQQAGLNREEVPRAYKELLERLTPSDDQYTLEIANQVLKSISNPVLDSYKSGLSQYFHANLQEVDFVRNGKAIKENVNRWVNEKTRGKITSLLDSPLDPSTVLFLLNAVYFKGTWKTQFESKDTKPKTFYNSGINAKQVSMMHMKKDANYTVSRELNSKVLELPYAGEDLSMVILLPHERNGLEDLKNTLTLEKLQEAIRNLRETPSVSIQLPSYKLETKYDLKNYLEALGLTDVFSDGADLSGISEDIGLKVSQVMHKATVEVNEKGSEAAAVTGVVVVPISAILPPERPVTFHADHPFMFAIINRSDSLILFLGSVNNL